MLDEKSMAIASVTRRPEKAERRVAPGPIRCRRRFLRFFPGGFRETYLEWERNSKWYAHEDWEGQLHGAEFQRLLREGQHAEAAARALRIESPRRVTMGLGRLREPPGVAIQSLPVGARLGRVRRVESR